MRQRGDRGFTLAEVLVATMLLSVVMTAVYTLFHSAVGSWRAVDKEFDMYQEARSVVTEIRREYGSLLPQGAAIFEGTDDGFTMYTVSEPMNLETGEGRRLLQVRYYLLRSGRRKRLVREERPVQATLPIGVPKEGLDPDRLEKSLGPRERFTVADNVENFKVTYLWTLNDDNEMQGGTPNPARHVLWDRHNPEWFLGYPQGLIVELTLRDPRNREEKYSIKCVMPTTAPNTRWTEKKLYAKLSG